MSSISDNDHDWSQVSSKLTELHSVANEQLASKSTLDDKITQLQTSLFKPGTDQIVSTPNWGSIQNCVQQIRKGLDSFDNFTDEQRQFVRDLEAHIIQASQNTISRNSPRSKQHSMSLQESETSDTPSTQAEGIVPDTGEQPHEVTSQTHLSITSGTSAKEEIGGSLQDIEKQHIIQQFMETCKERERRLNPDLRAQIEKLRDHTKELKAICAKECDQWERIDDIETQLQEIFGQIPERDHPLSPLFDIGYIKKSNNTMGIEWDEYFDLNVQIIINKITLHQCFPEEVKHAVLNELRSNQLQSLLPQDIGVQDLEQLEVTVSSLPQKQETHHQGRVSIKVIIKQGERTVSTLYYKPRSAAIDKAVLKYLTEVNSLIQEHLPTDDDLVILDFPNTSPPFSLWQEVVGKNFPSGDERLCPIYYASKPELYHGCDRAAMEGKVVAALHTLDSVLSLINVSDLHAENVVFQLQEAQNPKVIPIDLENIQKDMPTQLLGEESATPISDPKILRLASEFKKDIVHTAPYRMLVASTEDLMGIKIENQDSAFNLITQYITGSQEFNPMNGIQIKNLRKGLLECALYNDTPYFTIYQNMLYFGFPSAGLAIAQKR